MNLKKVLCFALAAVLAGAFLTGCDNNGGGNSSRGDSRKESYNFDLDQVKSMVNDMLRKELGSEAAKCLKVKVTEKIDQNHYRAKAMLDNGNDIRVAIELDGADIVVSIPED